MIEVTADGMNVAVFMVMGVIMGMRMGMGVLVPLAVTMTVFVIVREGFAASDAP